MFLFLLQMSEVWSFFSSGIVWIWGKQSKGSEHYLPKGMRFWSVNIIGHGA